MKIIYVADDGTQFDNRRDCEDYEFKQDLPSPAGLKFYDINGNLMSDNLFDEYVYNNCYTIEIPTEEALQYVSFVAEYCGWCELYHLPSIGTYDFIENPFKACQFVKREV